MAGHFYPIVHATLYVQVHMAEGASAGTEIVEVHESYELLTTA
jgi:hypothetical protein